jgi:beta-N-acetylhexosaminidase
MSDLHRHLLIGLEGFHLSAWERQMLRTVPPAGVILFSRNCESPDQVRALLNEVRQLTGEPIWAAIDEEGGRVNRMPWAPFNKRRPAAFYGDLWQRDAQAAVRAVYEDNLLVGEALENLGFTHNCAPVLDIFHPEGHGIIGDRAYAADVDTVASLAEACMRGLRKAGIAAVGKHFPGHGRAVADSHVAVPCVAASENELLAEAQGFARLIRAGMQHVMTAHVVYSQVDDKVATMSSLWLGGELRGRFGFSGKIWSDDLSMKGAGEDVSAAAHAALDAGCDVLLICVPGDVRRIYAALAADMSGSAP